MRPLVAALLLIPALAPAGAVKRSSLVALERSFDQRLERALPDDSFWLLGNTRGFYLEHYGAVFTTEVSLVNTPGLSPFRPSYSKEQLTRLHDKKMQRIPLLKKILEQALVNMAASLDEVPAGEQVVVGVSLFCFSWEDSSGMPSQVVMRGERRKLIDLQAGRLPAASVITVQEF